MKRRDIIKPIVLKILLLFYLASTFIGATHIHNQKKKHLDGCQICVIVKAFTDADLPKNGSIDIGCTLCNYLIIPLYSISLKVVNLKGYFSHAPPLLSY